MHGPASGAEFRVSERLAAPGSKQTMRNPGHRPSGTTDKPRPHSNQWSFRDFAAMAQPESQTAILWREQLALISDSGCRPWQHTSHGNTRASTHTPERGTNLARRRCVIKVLTAARLRIDQIRARRPMTPGITQIPNETPWDTLCKHSVPISLITTNEQDTGTSGQARPVVRRGRNELLEPT